ncbi:MAG: glycosyltransferase family 4 protein [Thermoplasmatales archaeon]|nr:glycosyltransferase family 4 protein [Thermoplasmatales archaeon]
MKLGGAIIDCHMNLARELIKEDKIKLYFIHHSRSEHPLYKEAEEIIIPRTPLLGELKLNKYGLDILHFHAVPWWRPSLLITKPKKIASIHGDIWWSEPSLMLSRDGYSLNWYKHIAAKCLESTMGFTTPKISKYLDMIMPVSHDLGDRLPQYLGVQKERIRVVYNGIDHDLFKPVPDVEAIIRRKYNIDRSFMLHVSNYIPQKNPIALFKVFKQLIREGLDLDLVIIGKKWNNVYKTFLDYDSMRRVKVMGYIPLKDLPLFYSAAKVFFFPSYYESFGIPVVESMACGTPVVASNAYSIPEIAGGSAILCRPDDYFGFARGIREILEDEELRKRLVRKGLKNAERFSWKRACEETIKVYEEVISQ